MLLMPRTGKGMCELLSCSGAAFSQRVLSRYCDTQTSLLPRPAQLGPTHSQHHYIWKYQNYINSTYQGSK